MTSFEQNPAYLAFAERLLGVKFNPADVTWLTSLAQNGSILGVVVFSRFTEGNCEVTVASQSPHFLTKGFALNVAFYAFGQLKMRRVTAFIAVENERSLSLAEQLGFRIEGTVKSWFAGGDAFILGLLRNDCKWLKDRHGQPQRTDPT